jgi:hypothetical protein
LQIALCDVEQAKGARFGKQMPLSPGLQNIAANAGRAKGEADGKAQGQEAR